MEPHEYDYVGCPSSENITHQHAVAIVHPGKWGPIEVKSPPECTSPRLEPSTRMIQNDAASYGRTYLEVTVNGLQMNGILDSGANVSIINESLAVQVSDRSTWLPVRRGLLNASDDMMDLAGRMLANLEIGDQVIEQELVICSQTGQQLALGDDFLTRNAATLQFYPRSVSLNGRPVDCHTANVKQNEKVTATVQFSNPVIVHPRSVMEFEINMPGLGENVSSFLEGDLVLMEPLLHTVPDPDAEQRWVRSEKLEDEESYDNDDEEEAEGTITEAQLIQSGNLDIESMTSPWFPNGLLKITNGKLVLPLVNPYRKPARFPAGVPLCSLQRFVLDIIPIHEIPQTELEKPFNKKAVPNKEKPSGVVPENSDAPSPSSLGSSIESSDETDAPQSPEIPKRLQRSVPTQTSSSPYDLSSFQKLPMVAQKVEAKERSPPRPATSCQPQWSWSHRFRTTRKRKAGVQRSKEAQQRRNLSRAILMESKMKKLPEDKEVTAGDIGARGTTDPLPSLGTLLELVTPEENATLLEMPHLKLVTAKVLATPDVITIDEDEKEASPEQLMLQPPEPSARTPEPIVDSRVQSPKEVRFPEAVEEVTRKEPAVAIEEEDEPSVPPLRRKRTHLIVPVRRQEEIETESIQTPVKVLGATAPSSLCKPLLADPNVDFQIPTTEDKGPVKSQTSQAPKRDQAYARRMAQGLEFRRKLSRLYDRTKEVFRKGLVAILQGQPAQPHPNVEPTENTRFEEDVTESQSTDDLTKEKVAAPPEQTQSQPAAILEANVSGNATEVSEPEPPVWEESSSDESNTSEVAYPPAPFAESQSD